MILLRFNLPAIKINIGNIEYIDARQGTLYIQMKNGKHYIGYHLKQD